jgi:hypothetical protein
VINAFGFAFKTGCDNCSKLRQLSKRKAPPRQRSERGQAVAPSAHGPNPPPPQQQGQGAELEVQRRRSGAVSGPNAAPGTPSRLAGEPRVSTTTTTTARATTTIVGADGATTATTTTSAAGHQASGVHGLSARASVTRSSPRASGPRPTYRGTMGTPTPAYGSRTTGSHATLVGRTLISL